MRGQLRCEDVQKMLGDFLKGTLSGEERSIVQSHVDQCAECKAVLEFFRGMPAKIGALPESIPPTRNLWPEISERISTQQPIQYPRLTLAGQRSGQQPDRNSIRRTKWRWKTKALVAFSLIAFAAGAWFALRTTSTGWNVAHIEGVLRLGNEPVSGEGTLHIGDWLETDNISRAKIDVGLIGELEVEPNSRLRLIDAHATNHRVELEKGTIRARIWSPPRLFFVETAAATVIDLGCAYTLSVDSIGVGLLKVSAGYVALIRDGKESIVPAGAACETRPGFGPGTPFRLSAAPLFRSALTQFDLENGKGLTSLLAQARTEDAVTLWHLIKRTNGNERQKVYDRLAALVPIPSGVTRDGILNENPKMMQKLGEEIGIVL